MTTHARFEAKTIRSQVLLNGCVPLSLLAIVSANLAIANTTGNLVINPGAETGDLSGWTVASGPPLAAYAPGRWPTQPCSHGGVWYFMGGHNLPGSYSTMYQDISFIPQGYTANSLDNGQATIDVAFYGRTWDQPSQDGYQVYVEFLNASGQSFGWAKDSGLWRNTGDYQLFDWRGISVPIGARTARINLHFVRYNGGDSDGSIDDISLRLNYTPGTGYWKQASSGSWGDASRWTVAAPGSMEDACFQQGGTYAVSLNTNTNVRSLSVTAGDVTFTGATLNASSDLVIAGGAAEVTGNGSKLVTGSRMLVGSSSTGANGVLRITAGGQAISSADTYVGAHGGIGQITLTGDGSLLQTRDLYVSTDSVNSATGGGTVTVASGATLNLSGGMHLDSAPQSRVSVQGGSVSVAGPSAVALGATFEVSGGQATFAGTLSNAGTVSVSGGQATVNGTLSNSGNVSVSGGTLMVSAYSGASTGSTLVKGQGSRFSAQSLSLGGQSQFAVRESGSATATAVDVGPTDGTNGWGQLVVDGSGSSVGVDGLVRIGAHANSSIVVSNNGQLRAGALDLGGGSKLSMTGGTVEVSNWARVGSDSAAGQLAVQGAMTRYGSSTSNGTSALWIGPQSGTALQPSSVEVSQGATAYLGRVLVGAAGGKGQLQVSGGAKAYARAVDLSASDASGWGKLVVDGAGSALEVEGLVEVGDHASSQVVLSNQALLKAGALDSHGRASLQWSGGGKLVLTGAAGPSQLGALSIPSGGTLSVLSEATRIAGDFASGEGSTLEVGLSSEGAGRVQVAGQAALGGALRLVLSDAAHLPQPGERWTILGYAGHAGSFGEVQNGTGLAGLELQLVDGAAGMDLLLGGTAGDASLDGQVNYQDLLAVAAHYQSASGLWSAGDFTRDGLVDGADLLLVEQHYEGPSFAADWARAQEAVVPEPAALGLLGMGALCLAGLRRRTER